MEFDVKREIGTLMEATSLERVSRGDSDPIKRRLRKGNAVELCLQKDWIFFLEEIVHKRRENERRGALSWSLEEEQRWARVVCRAQSRLSQLNLSPNRSNRYRIGEKRNRWGLGWSYSKRPCKSLQRRGQRSLQVSVERPQEDERSYFINYYKIYWIIKMFMFKIKEKRGEEVLGVV